MRNQILEKILVNFQSLDHTLESGINIIQANELELDKLKDISRESNKQPIELEKEEIYREGLELVLKKQKALLKDIEDKQNHLLKEINQLNKKNQVINSYITVDRGPIFIDKDL